MAAILYFIIYISNLISIFCFNTQNDFFISSILKKFLPLSQYEKFFTDYNINIKLKTDKFEKEFLINTTYISNKVEFDFSYSGNPLSLNETSFYLLSKNIYKNKILLIRDNSTFNNYIIQNKPLIRFLSKVIIIPKNIINNIDIIANYCFYYFSLFVIEIDEDIFDRLESYNDDSTIDIISKKIDLFPVKFLIILIITIFVSIFICTFIFRYLLKKNARGYLIRQYNLAKSINYHLNFKLIILSLLLFDLYFLYYTQGIIIEYTSFIKSILIFLMIINKVGNISFLLKIYRGKGLYLERGNITFMIILNLTGFYMIFYILFNLFINPLRISQAYFILSIIASFPIFSQMIYYSLTNLIFLLKAYYQLRKVKKYLEKYGSSIRLKIFIVFIQFIFLLFFIYSYLFINNYILFKKGLCFVIEKDILFQCLDSLFILLIGLLYCPRKWPKGYHLNIIIIHNSKKTSKIKISSGDNYISSINKDYLDTDKNIKKYVRDNRNNFYVVLNPKVFLDNDKQDEINTNINEDKEKENPILANDIKLGKLI